MPRSRSTVCSASALPRRPLVSGIWLEARWKTAADCETGPLQLMYGIDGRAELAEETLDHLEGYRGSAPGAYRQCGLSATAA